MLCYDEIYIKFGAFFGFKSLYVIKIKKIEGGYKYDFQI